MLRAGSAMKESIGEARGVVKCCVRGCRAAGDEATHRWRRIARQVRYNLLRLQEKRAESAVPDPTHAEQEIARLQAQIAALEAQLQGSGAIAQGGSVAAGQG